MLPLPYSTSLANRSVDRLARTRFFRRHGSVDLLIVVSSSREAQSETRPIGVNAVVKMGIPPLSYRSPSPREMLTVKPNPSASSDFRISYLYK